VKPTTIDVKASGCVNPWHPPECPRDLPKCQHSDRLENEDGREFVVLTRAEWDAWCLETFELRKASREDAK
jgi:hypothetical protein